MRGYVVSEIAVDWTNVAGSKVNVFLDSPKMLSEVLGIWLSSKIGHYKQLSHMRDADAIFGSPLIGLSRDSAKDDTNRAASQTPFKSTKD